MPVRLDAAAANFEATFKTFLAARRARAQEVDAAVAEILEDVCRRGDEALVAYTERFDRQRLSPKRLRVTADEVADAAARLDVETAAAVDLAARRIEDFHRRQLPEDLDYRDPEGVRLGARWRPIAAVGVYVPGGTAAYPSTVLMNAVPARVAGVKRLVMCVPTPDGALNPAVAYAARRAALDEVYRVGGVQAVAALAFGTETIVPVDKIVGPGNAYVVAAKKQVFGVVGIDMIAGPSEIVVVADADNDPSWIAADLLSQAEHDPASQAVLITDGPAFADSVLAAAEAHLARLSRADVARASWESHGAVILVPGLEAAIPIVDRLAPEHLELAVPEPEALAAEVTNAGAVLLGRYTPEAVADYVAGPNHVLPTGGAARFASGLGVLDFMKRTTYVGCDRASLDRIGPAAVRLAGAEGFDAHALSVSLRLEEEVEDVDE